VSAVSTDAISPREVLGECEFFKALPPEALELIVPGIKESRYPAGSIIVWEGESGEDYYLVAAGQVEVWAARGRPGPRPETVPWSPDPNRFNLVGHLAAGTGFGEMALLQGGYRHTSIRAATDVVLYAVDKPSFMRAIDEHRGMALALEEEMTLRSLATSAGKTSPFANLEPETLRWLALRLQRVSYGSREDIVRQGEEGDALYIIRSGRVEALGTRPDGSTHQLVTLGPGQPFGEQALLAREPRSATVRTLEPVEVLRLSRDDFQSVLREHPERGDYFLKLSLQRQRPRRIEYWAIERQDGFDGKSVFILKDTKHARYLKLSEEGAFLWELMDGERTVRDLALAYYQRYQAFGLDPVLEVMLQLHGAGFLIIQHLEQIGQTGDRHRGPLGRIWHAVSPWVTRTFRLPDVDHVFARVYRYALRPIFTWPAQIVLISATIAGAIVFTRYLVSGRIEAEAGSPEWIIILSIVFGLALQLSLHELAHAVTCKHFGREVHYAGAGWLFFLPIIFVDTSDMWMAPRRARALVSFAGPYTNFLLSGLAACAIPFVHDRFAQALLFEFASAGYVLGLLNMNPLMEFDGYYVLMDLLEVPNLRAKALAYLGSVLWRVKQTTSDPRLKRIFTLYGTLALLYTVFIAFSILRGYQAFIENVVNNFLPVALSRALGLAVALSMTALVIGKAWHDLREWRAVERHAR
jgi:CRP-like cAMP-binding protein/Zn-dependent protease